MPRLLPNRFATECIREFERAADERHADAVRLADSGRRTGAIYLFGYVTEMLLKSAVFRLTGRADDDPITLTDLWQMVGARPTTLARSLGLPGAANLHDLAAWSDLIVAYRASRGLVYPDAGFATALTSNVSVVARRWTEALRYHKNVAYAHELNTVRTSCWWVMQSRNSI